MERKRFEVQKESQSGEEGTEVGMEGPNPEPTCLAEGSQLSTGPQARMPTGARRASRQGGSLAWGRRQYSPPWLPAAPQLLPMSLQDVSPGLPSSEMPDAQALIPH